MRFLRKGRALLGVVLATVSLNTKAAAGATMGNWSLGSLQDGRLYAIAMNDSGGILMKSCDPKSGLCGWYLGTTTSCSTNLSAPALMTSSIGTASVMLYCDGPVEMSGTRFYRYQLGSPDAIDSVVSSASIVGIAIALQDGRFLVLRFSLQGGKEALSTLMEGAARMLKPAPPKGTRDQAL